MELQSRMTVYLAFVGVLAMLGGIIYYASLGNAELEQAGIELASIELIDNSAIEDQAKFNVAFLVKNPSDTTFTVSLIQYELYGDGVLLGSGQYSTEDISMPGRASFFPNTEIPLKSIFVLSKSNVDPAIFQSAIENNISNFSAEGIMTTQTTWTVNEKEFKSGF
jgi:LEA14-like dessication related protein